MAGHHCYPVSQQYQWGPIAHTGETKFPLRRLPQKLVVCKNWLLSSQKQEPVPPLGICPPRRGEKKRAARNSLPLPTAAVHGWTGRGRQEFIFKGFVKQRRFELWFLSCLLSSKKAYWCVWLWWTVWIAVCLASHYMHCFTVSISYPLFIAFSVLSFFVSSVSCFLPPLQQASYAASSFSSVPYCVQQTKVPFTPEDTGATQGLTMSVSNSFLNRHSSFPVHSVSCSPHFNTCAYLCRWKACVQILCLCSRLQVKVKVLLGAFELM